MKKIFYAVTAALLMFSSSASAFSFKNLLNKENVESVVTAVTGGFAVSPTTLAGTWVFSSSAVKLESSNALTEVAGSVATSQMESKLDSAMAKVGIKSGMMSFTFGSDMTFSCTTKNRTLNGTYTIDDDKKITLQFQTAGTVNIGRVAAYTELAPTTLSLLFNADKLMNIVDAVSSFSGSKSLQAANSLLQNYDGVLVGFDFTK